ncbi:MAG: hypothetical protein IIB44_10040 [Candidatus Marinimicrobia bacterium]|nr:hypothetical protein [Candidatus Neomarinimicrobiota bacterium]
MSVWCAFYASVPAVFYDYVYTGLIEGLGFSYLFSHWCLTIFYFIIWIEILPVGFIMERWSENE